MTAWSAAKPLGEQLMQRGGNGRAVAAALTVSAGVMVACETERTPYNLRISLVPQHLIGMIILYCNSINRDKIFRKKNTYGAVRVSALLLSRQKSSMRSKPLKFNGG